MSKSTSNRRPDCRHLVTHRLSKQVAQDAGMALIVCVAIWYLFLAPGQTVLRWSNAWTLTPRGCGSTACLMHGNACLDERTGRRRVWLVDGSIVDEPTGGFERVDPPVMWFPGANDGGATCPSLP